MLRVAIQLKDIIASNVTSAIDAASNPAKMLHRLQREIEESIMALEGERSSVLRRRAQLEAQLTQNELREAAWSDKAKVAMDNGNEDLARQALMAREDCRELVEQIKSDMAQTTSDLSEIEEAIRELEVKREDARERVKDQAAADERSGSGGAPSKTDEQLDRISQLERRTEFATEEVAQSRGHAAVNREIEEMRRKTAIDAELEALRDGSAPAKRSRRKAK